MEAGLDSDKKLVYSVKDVQDMLGIGKNQAYDLVKKDLFPCVYVGKKILIPKEPFHDWLNNSKGRH